MMAPPSSSSSSSSSSVLLLLFLVLVLVLFSLSTASDVAFVGGHAPLSLMMPGRVSSLSSSSCRGSAGECVVGFDDEEEMEMEMEMELVPIRRVLGDGTGGYISYAALRRDSVPCSQRGASYYNCRPGAQANPYSRGCSAITRCRS